MLTDLACRRAKPKERAYKLADAHGLYLYVLPSGSRSWRLKYRFGGKERRLVFGMYPEVTLTQARDQREQARRLMRDGTDPGVASKQRAAEAAAAAVQTVRAVATAWHHQQADGWKPRHARQVMERLEKHVFPPIGAMAARDVTPALVLSTIRAIERTGSHEMAHRVRQYISDIYGFAIASGCAENDPAHVIRKALVPVRRRLRPAVTRLKDAQDVLRTIEARDIYAATKLASRLLALTAARPGVIVRAERREFEDLHGRNPIWRIPAAKMKLTRERSEDVSYEFIIPLSRQAVDVVQAALSLIGEHRSLLFPSARAPQRPISDNTLGKAYRDAGFRGVHVPHGWRATFSTRMNERAAARDRDEERAIIDLMLAHIPGGVEAAYNRAAYMPRRRLIAQEWADLLTHGLPTAAELVTEQRGSSPRAARARRARDRAVVRRCGAPVLPEARSRPARARSQGVASLD